MRPKTELSKDDEQYLQNVMTELARIRGGGEAQNQTPIQTSDPVTYYPNTAPGLGPWTTPPTQITPAPVRRQRSFTETYNMGLTLTRLAAEAFEEETGQTISQLAMAQLAVRIAQLLENW